MEDKKRQIEREKIERGRKVRGRIEKISKELGRIERDETYSI